jgi:hypothetical protein
MALAAWCAGSDGTRFRGPNGTGVADGAKLPAAIGDGVNVSWKAAIPTGKSSPVLTADRIFLTGHDQGRLSTFAVDRRNDASPAAGDGKVYLISRNGNVTVPRAGNPWQTESTGELDGRRSTRGRSTCVLSAQN